MQIITKSITELRPYPNNPRKNDEAVDIVAKSIEEYGFKNPILIDGDGVIIAGHTRYRASKRLGLEEVPVIVVDDLTPAQIQAYRIMDNRSTEYAEWDTQKLLAELHDLEAEEFDITLTGFDTTMFELDVKDEEMTEVVERIKKDLSQAVKSIFEVVIECEDEREQEQIFNRLKAEGLKVRVLTV